MAVRGRVLVLALAAVLGTGRVASSADRRPSFVLVVLDTVRYDAVSAYGEIGTSTPTVDALAGRGLLYRHAYANANWTLPSHATLFTGLLPSQHGVNAVHVYAPDSLVMLAERLRDAGYETVGISDNPYVGKSTNLTQGFDRFTSLETPMLTGVATVDVESAVSAWLAARNGDRPYFLFVNLMDAHAPYKNHAENPFLVVDPRTAALVAQDDRYLCSPLSNSSEIDILWSLYIGGVVAADARLGALLRQLRNAGVSDGRTVIIVTADHGEHFGEHRLILHDYGVYDELLHVPLVVVGAPGAANGSIEEAVQLADIQPSILDWAGIPVPEGFVGRPLPVRNRTPIPERALIAENIDWGDDVRETIARVFHRHGRERCTAEDRIDGTLRAVIRYPFKLITYDRYPARLYDLARDPEESTDRTADEPLVASSLASVVTSIVAAARPPAAEVVPAHSFDPAELERLRALGYVGGDPRPAVNSPARDQ